jgi:DNA-binding MarR family transcriptional regulator
MKSDEEDLLTDLGRLYGSLKRSFDRSMVERGASLARTKMLILIQKEGGTVRATDIAERFGIAPRTVTEALDGLEREGMILRTPDPADRRAKRISITADGEAAVAVTEPIRQALSKRILLGLGPEEQASFHATIRKLLRCIDED